jgi:hypothetical protein
MCRGRPRAATMLPGADAIPMSFCPNIPARTVKGLGFRVSVRTTPCPSAPTYLFPTRTVSVRTCMTKTGRVLRKQGGPSERCALVQMPAALDGARAAGNAANCTLPLKPSCSVAAALGAGASHARAKAGAALLGARVSHSPCARVPAARPSPHGDLSSPYRKM